MSLSVCVWCHLCMCEMVKGASLLYTLETESPWTLELSAFLARKFQSPSSLPAISIGWGSGYRHTRPYMAIHSCLQGHWESEFGSSGLHNKHSYPQNQLCNPQLITRAHAHTRTEKGKLRLVRWPSRLSPVEGKNWLSYPLTPKVHRDMCAHTHAYTACNTKENAHLIYQHPFLFKFVVLSYWTD